MTLRAQMSQVADSHSLSRRLNQAGSLRRSAKWPGDWLVNPWNSQIVCAACWASSSKSGSLQKVSH